jgi:hypothetical protein
VTGDRQSALTGTTVAAQLALGVRDDFADLDAVHRRGSRAGSADLGSGGLGRGL